MVRKRAQKKKEKTDKTIIYCRSLAVCGEVYALFQESMTDIPDAKSLYAMYHSKTPPEVCTGIVQ